MIKAAIHIANDHGKHLINRNCRRSPPRPRRCSKPAHTPFFSPSILYARRDEMRSPHPTAYYLPAPYPYNSPGKHFARASVGREAICRCGPSGKEVDGRGVRNVRSSVLIARLHTCSPYGAPLLIASFILTPQDLLPISAHASRSWINASVVY